MTFAPYLLLACPYADAPATVPALCRYGQSPVRLLFSMRAQTTRATSLAKAMRTNVGGLRASMPASRELDTTPLRARYCTLL